MKRAKHALLAAGAALLSALQAHATDKPAFTIAQIMSAPFPSDLVAAPTGGTAAWVFNAKGVRNVWVAEPPDYLGRQVTNYAEDDGQAIAGLDSAPDGQSLVYVRGGEERGEEYPNPQSKPNVPEQAVWLIALEKGPPRYLGEGKSARVAPAGNRVAFLKKGQIWWAPLDGSRKAEQLLHLQGECHSLRWSPHGSRLAFVCTRKDHSLVAVYDWQARTVRWLDPSVDRDAEPAWSPDGKHVAFVRQAAAQGLPFTPARSGEPWSLRVADAEEGRGREVWKADKGAGSVFHSVVAENQIWWAAGDRIAFPWERDGWCHLYSVAVGGGSAVLLTPGAFEVEHVSLSSDCSTLLFNSNQNDLDRRHLWSVSVAGGPPTLLTGGTGIEWAPTMTSDGRGVAHLRSDGRRPARPALQLNGKVRDLAPNSIPADFPGNALVEPQPVLFDAADGMTIHGQVFLPKSVNVQPRPAVIFFHGGSRRQMLLGWHPMFYYHNSYAMNQYLASRGYVVLAVNYRSGIGYGMEFREALNYGAGGASEFNDVLGAGLYLRGRPDVDPKRIGLWGGSYGGFLTALGLARASDLFAAGVDIHGVYDWNNVIRNFDPGYDPRAQQEAARLAFSSSPASSIKTWRSPVLVIHGDDDRNVPFSETVRLVEDLRKHNVAFEQLIFPGEVHDFLTHERWLQSQTATADFFDRHLKAKRH